MWLCPQLLPTLLLACACAPLLLAQNQVGPYDGIHVTDLFVCNDSDNLPMKVEMETKRSKEGHYATGQLTIPFPLDSTVSVVVTLSKCDNTGCKVYHEIVSNDTCNDAMKEIPSIVKKLMGAANKAVECPIPAGVYTVEKTTLFVESLENYPYLPYGKYILLLQLYKDGKKICCCGGEGYLEEKAYKPMGK